MIQIKLLSDYALLQQLPSRDNKKNQPGKEWANLQATLIPPDDKAGCNQGKKFPGRGYRCLSLGVARSVLLKMVRVERSTSWADNKVPLQGWKL